MVNQDLSSKLLDVENWSPIREHQAFQGIADDELRLILPFFRLVTLEPRRFLITEGQTTLDLYLILSGTLEVIKASDSLYEEGSTWGLQNNFNIASLQSGDVIGELSFITGEPRAASIRTTSTTIVLSIGPAELERFEQNFPVACGRMMRNMLGYVAECLKMTTANEVHALKSRLHHSILNSKANLFFSYVIGLLCIYNLAISTITNLSMDNNRASIISASIILIFSAVLALMVRQSTLSFQLFGLTLKNWKPALKESLLWSLLIIMVMVLIKWILISSVAKYEHLPLIDFSPAHQRYLAFNFLLYGLHSPLQEFITRGVLQGSLQRFFTGKNIALRAVIVSNALFSATHVHLLGGLLGVIVFVPGLFWGWLYTRHDNLLGVSISHILIGWTALFFLNLESLF